MIENFFFVQPELFAVRPQNIGNLPFPHAVEPFGVHLFGQQSRQFIRAQVHLSAVHAGAAKISHDGPIVLGQAEDGDDAARLVLPEKTPAFAADDDHGFIFFVCLHVYAHAVTRVAADENFPAAHGISDGVAAVAVYDDRPRVHGVADRVLRVAAHIYFRPVEIGAERVAGRALDRHCLIAQSRADIALSEAVLHGDLPIAALADGVVQFLKMELCSRRYGHDFLSSLLCFSYTLCVSFSFL